MSTQAPRGMNTRPTVPDNSQEGREAAIRAIFTEQRTSLAALFPKDGATLVERACAAAIAASRERDKKTGEIRLAKATPESIAAAVISVHHMGLEPGEEAYLVPFGATVQIIVGPKGLIKLMYRSGFVSSVEVHEVFGEQDEVGKPVDPGGDTFIYDLGDTPYIRHRKGLHGRRALRITHVYGIIRTTTGGVVRMVLTYEDVEFYRSFSKQANGPMWTDNWGGGARKTLIHRMAELIPRNAILSAALTQNENGAMEIPEEFMDQVRKRLAAERAGAAPMVEHVSGEPAAQGQGVAG